MKKINQKILLVAILIIAAFLRFYGLNWDQNQHLHPDERFLTMVANDISWPASITEYLGEQNPLSPYNNKHNFFVYGTFPVYLVKFASEVINFDVYDYNNITLVGRMFSALMDLGVVVLVFKISKLLFNNKIALIAALLYSIFVLPIQLSHFFTTDTFLVFFLLFSFYLLLRTLQKKRFASIFYSMAGMSFGLALASKISALYFLPLVLSVFFYLLLQKRSGDAFVGTLLFVIPSFLTWRSLDPKTFVPNSIFRIDPRFTANIEQLRSFNDPGSFFPPAVQWINSTPIIFPLKNLLVWGLGLPLGLLLLFSIIYLIFQNSKHLIKLIHKKGLNNIVKIERTNYFMIIFLVWSIGFFVYQGTEFVKAMRYFSLLYPFFALFIAVSLIKSVKNKKIIIIIFAISTIYPVSFMSIYFNKHTRIQASEWIYENIPPGSAVTCEHWDDCLPLPLGRNNSLMYQTESLELFNPDSRQKWLEINNQLERADYIILSSNRLWGSIPSVPDRYPETTQFYQRLFSNSSNFLKIAEFTSRPTIPILGVELIDDNADESFTVYDHPKVMIFKKSS